MGTRIKPELTAEKIAEFSFFKRFRYKLLDIIKPRINPELVMFSKMEKQVLFFIILSIIVGVSIFLVLEFGYIL